MAPNKKRRRDIDDCGSRKKSKTSASSTPRRVTRQMTTDAPRRAVFSAAELLENIVLCLPPKTIVGTQRTCRQFRDMVATSVKIQEHILMRRPSSERSLWQVQYRYPGQSALIKMILSDSEPDSKKPVAEPIELHPLLHALATRLHPKPRVLTDVTLTKRFAKGESESWSIMYLSKPPITAAEIRLRWEIKDMAKGRVDRTVQNDRGVIFGELIDAAMYQQCAEDDILRVKQNGIWSDEFLKDDSGTTKDSVERFEKQHGHRARWSIYWIDLCGAIVPIAEEWEQIRKAEQTRALDSWSGKDREQQFLVREVMISERITKCVSLV